MPDNSPLKPYLCENIEYEGTLKVTEALSLNGADGCVRIDGLKEGLGGDNPVSWTDVLMNWDGGPTCEDYDTCPAGGTSGVQGRRKPGTTEDFITCSEGEYYPAAGVYDAAEPTYPYRYTVPKMVCFHYPAGIDHFEMTYAVGPAGPNHNGKYGRNYQFGDSGAPDECAASGAG